MFLSHEVKDEVIQWIRDYFKESGPNSPVVIGISGGKDSTVTAAALVAAVGSSRVFGVLLPAGNDPDLPIAREVCKTLGIKSIEMNIADILNAQVFAMRATKYKDLHHLTDVSKCNNPARIRMCMLYLIANQIGGRVANTCNMSESYVGYDTKWGDQCGDFSPLQNFTATEVKILGRALGVPGHLIDKPPTDGMCGKTDEDRWGFSYQVLDNYLRGTEIPAEPTLTMIETMHKRAMHKLTTIQLPSFPYSTPTSRSLR